MPSVGKKHYYLVFLNLGWLFFFSGCASVPTVISIPPVAEPASSAAVDVSDYQEVLAAIASVMAQELKLPAVESSVIFYPSRQSYHTGVVEEAQKDLALLRMKFADRAA